MDCRGPYNDANIQKLDDNSRCFLGGWNGGCEIKGKNEFLGISSLREKNF